MISEKFALRFWYSNAPLQVKNINAIKESLFSIKEYSTMFGAFVRKGVLIVYTRYECYQFCIRDIILT